MSIREIENIFITLSDGCRLAARLWLPEDIAAEPLPAILEYLPYRKRDGTAIRDELTHPFFAKNAYACIRVDIRGSGESDGVLLDEYNKQEQADCLDVLRWIANQPWCNGKIGMMGISWGGFNSLQIAALRPPELAGIISLCSTDDRYADDIHYRGGCLLNDNFQWSTIMLGMMSRAPDKSLLGKQWRDVWLDRLSKQPLMISEWLRHQQRDEYWMHGSICEKWEAITCPVYLMGGWDDGYSNTIPRMMKALTCPRKALIGPWPHLYPHLPDNELAIDFPKEALRWWDHCLKGKDTGIMSEPMYRVWMNASSNESLPSSDSTQGYWMAQSTWPDAAVQSKHYYLNQNGFLDEESKDISIVSKCTVQTVGQAGGAWCGFGNGPEKPADQRVDDDASQVFDTGPLTSSLIVIGAPMVQLNVSVDRTRAFISVRLNEVMSDGRSIRISHGLLNLKNREGVDRLLDIIPGEEMKVSIQLDDIAHTFSIGSRLRLSISTTYWPLVFPSPEPVTLSMMTGLSSLSLPIQHHVNKLSSTFDKPNRSLESQVNYQREPSGRRWHERDFREGLVRYFVQEDAGRCCFKQHGLVHDAIRQEVYSIKDDDPLSANITIHYKIHVGREAWQTYTTAHTTMHADKDYFYLEARLAVYENDNCLLTREWQDKVERESV